MFASLLVNAFVNFRGAGYEEDFGFASCHSLRGGDLELARRPQERPRGLPAVTTDPGQPDPLDLQQVRLHAHSPMVFVGSSMGERPGAPCLKMEQNESKAWTVNSVTNLGKQVFPTHTLLWKVAMEAGKTPKKEKKRTTGHEKHLASGTLPPNLMRRTKGWAWPKVLLWWQAKGAERVKYFFKKMSVLERLGHSGDGDSPHGYSTPRKVSI